MTTTYSYGEIDFTSENQSIIDGAGDLTGGTEAAVSFSSYSRTDLYDGLITKSGADLRGAVSGRFGFGVDYGVSGLTVDSNVTTTPYARFPDKYRVSSTTTNYIITGENSGNVSFASEELGFEFSISLIAEMDFYVRLYAGLLDNNTQLIVREGFDERFELLTINAEGLELFNVSNWVDTDQDAKFVASLWDMLADLMGVPGDAVEVEDLEKPLVSLEPEVGGDLGTVTVDLSGDAIGASSTSGAISDSSSDTLVDVDLDLLAMLSLIGLPPMSFEFTVTNLGIFEIALLGATIGPTIDFDRNVTMTPELNVTIEFSDEVEILGDTVSTWTGVWEDFPGFKMLSDSTTLTPTFTQNAEFDTDLDIGIDFEGTFSALEAGFEGAGVTVGIGPLFEKEYETRISTIDIYDKTFDVGGFDDFVGTPITVSTNQSYVNPGVHDGIDEAPEATDDSYRIHETEVLELTARDLFGNDYDPDPFDVFTIEVYALTEDGEQITLGELSQTHYDPDGEDGYSSAVPGSLSTITYDPSLAFLHLNDFELGEDSFGYTITDSSGLTDTGIVTIEIEGVTNPSPDDFLIDPTIILTGDLFADNGNGADVEGFGEIASINGAPIISGEPFELPSGATLTVNEDGTFSYDASALDHAALNQDSFYYTANSPIGRNWLGDRDGKNRFQIDPGAYDGNLGHQVSSAGDFNGDGWLDILLTAPMEGADTTDDFLEGDGTANGAAYVLYGSSDGFDAIVDLGNLTAETGLRIVGEDGWTGWSADYAGDVNGDGYDDIVLGAPGFDDQPDDPFAGNGWGYTYVIYGSGSTDRDTLNLADLTQDDGFYIEGGSAGFGFSLGRDVAGIGDINMDGFDDIITVGGGSFPIKNNFSVATAVIFGGEDIPLHVEANDLDSSLGFRLSTLGAHLTDDPIKYTSTASGVGDFNGDGIDDFIVGGPDPAASFLDDAQPNRGNAWVVYGRDPAVADFTSYKTLTSMPGEYRMRIWGHDDDTASGLDVAGIGDFNGDGLADVVITEPYAGDNGEGEAYVIYGTDDPDTVSIKTEELDGTNGFTIFGAQADGGTGLSVSGVGDVNGDGLDDLIIGGPLVDLDNIHNPGTSYVVFGTTDGIGATLKLADLDGRDGVFFEGANSGDHSGVGVSGLGDLNKDGFDDIIIGMPGSLITKFNPTDGGGYVVFGPFEFEPAEVTIDFFDGTAPVIPEGQTFTTTEHQGPGGMVGRVQTDEVFAVAGFAITGGNDAGYFEITDDGRILLTEAGAASEANDFESGANSFTIEITATDNSGNISDPVAVTLTVADAVAATDDAFTATEAEGATGNLFDDNGSGADDADHRILAQIDGQTFGDGSAITLASGALLAVDDTGDFTYDPNGAVFAGATDSFTYRSSSTDSAYSVIGLDDLGSFGGFQINGVDLIQYIGHSVEVVGDFNGDGYDDILLGAPKGTLPSVAEIPGEAFLVFGGPQAPDDIFDLSNLDGENGFKLIGAADGDEFGTAVAGVGDVNGDGFDDIAIGATNVHNDGAGQVFVLFGSAAPSDAQYELSELDDDEGLVIEGIDPGDRLGEAVSAAGDLNGDGLDDILIGAPRYDHDGVTDHGAAHVIFGQDDGFAAQISVDSMSSSQGFTLVAYDDSDEVGQLGRSVAALGDVNGDGFTDFAVGAPNSDADGIGQAGTAYVVFGNGVGFDAEMDLAAMEASAGFRLAGETANDVLGWDVASAGDVNGDGVGDFLATAISYNGGRGRTYVVFGQEDGFADGVDVSALDGTDGFIVTGRDTTENLGYAATGVGDFNGDGFDDILIGAYGAGDEDQGQSYLIFGAADGWDDRFRLNDLNGVRGLEFDGIAEFDQTGRSVSGGDINGDGFDDIVIGARTADPGGTAAAGQAYVIYGRAHPLSEEATVTIDVVFDELVVKDDAFAIQETDTLSGNLFDDNGQGIDGGPDDPALVLFDVDGRTDLVGVAHELASGAVLTVQADGSFDYDPIAAFSSLADGEIFTDTFTYAIGPDAPFQPVLADLDGTTGFRFEGAEASGKAGTSVTGIGDINGDGIDDVAIGAAFADGSGLVDGGLVYVVFGSEAGFDPTITPADLDGTNGFVIEPKGAEDETGYSISGIGDFNDDGIDDFVIGAPRADRGSATDRGEVHVVFGKDTVLSDLVPDPEGFAATLSISSLDGTNGFEIIGAQNGGESGHSVSGGGDINGDGIADLIIGTRYGSKSGLSKSGDTYVVFGTSEVQDSDFALADIDGANGFRVEGAAKNDRSGSSVASIGDFNGDGYDDFAIGAHLADYNGSSSGEAYVVFGFDDTSISAMSAGDLDGANGFTFVGADAGDRMGRSVGAAGDLNGDGFADVAIGASSDDDGGTDSGSVFIIYGRAKAMPVRRAPKHMDGTTGTLIQGDKDGDATGVSVASVGDINSDGLDDLIVSAINVDAYFDDGITLDAENVGAVTVIYGNADKLGSTIDLSQDVDQATGYTILGTEKNQQLGTSVKGAGDVNGDGVPDIIIGAPGDDGAADNAGAAYVVFGQERLRAEVSIAVEGINDAPVLDLAETLEIDENLTSLDNLSITDEDGDILIVELTGDDAELFDVHAEDSVAETAGIAFDAGQAGPPPPPPPAPKGRAPTQETRELAFRSAPNFEKPTDADGDGYYDIIVTASDGISTVSQSVRIKVNDANDLPNLVDDRYAVEPGETVSGNLLTEHGLDTDEDGDTLTVVALLGDQSAIGTPYRLPSGALLTVDSDGEFVYDPDGAFTPVLGEPSPRETLTYTVADGRGGTSIAKLIIAATIDGVEWGSDDGEGMSGGPFDSHINGAGGDDLIHGDGGDDTIEGGDGHDRIFGGDWNDLLDGQAGDDTIYGDANEDDLSGGDGNDDLSGGDGHDTLDGGAGDDNLFGDDGADSLSGGAGRDLLDGGDGDDTLSAGAHDTVDGGSGQDRLSVAELASGGPDIYRLLVDMAQGRAENHNGFGVVEFSNIEEVAGSDSNDLMRGSSDAETLFGMGEADWFYASHGDDIYDGGLHRDMVPFASWSGGAAPVYGPFDFGGLPPVGVVLSGVSVDLGDSTNNTGFA